MKYHLPMGKKELSEYQYCRCSWDCNKTRYLNSSFNIQAVTYFTLYAI